MPLAVANRYARALADVVARTADYRQVLQDLEAFHAAYGESAELRELCASPALPLPEKLKVVEAIAVRLNASPITVNFLRVLLTNYRMPLLGEAVGAFRKIANDRLGIVQVAVYSAADLSEAERDTLRGRFREMTGKDVVLEFHVQRELVGGIRAQIGSTVYDGTVRGHLERIREGLQAP
jgi:F-type H+-transporting ATPase subunit delta